MLGDSGPLSLRQWAFLAGFAPITAVQLATAAHGQTLLRGLGMDVGTTWLAYSAAAAVAEGIMAVWSPRIPTLAMLLLLILWSCATVALWTAPVVLAGVANGQLLALMAHGVTHAGVWLSYSALFPVLFPSADARAAAVGRKQQFVIAGLLFGTFVVSLVGGPALENFMAVGLTMGAACAVFVMTGGGVLMAVGGASKAPSSSEGSFWPILSLGDTWAFLATDFLSALANALVTNAFPLLMAHVFRFGVDIKGVMLHVGAVPPLAKAIRPLAAALLPDGWYIRDDTRPDSDEWDIGLPQEVLVPMLYLVFYAAGAVVGPMWAHFVRLRMASWSAMWALGVAAYSVALYCVVGIKSYHGALLQVGLAGAMVSVFLVLPELFSGGVVDQLPPGGRRGGSQALTALKALSRRASGALQGYVSALVLAGAGFTTAEAAVTLASSQAISRLYLWYPVALLGLSIGTVFLYSKGSPEVHFHVGSRRSAARKAEAKASAGRPAASARASVRTKDE